MSKKVYYVSVSLHENLDRECRTLLAVVQEVK